jgi:hypothetical protein
MSGNVDEWVNDVGVTNSPLHRGVYGGSWMTAAAPVSARRYARPDTTQPARGFRVTSAFGNDNGMLLIRIPYFVCLCGYQRVQGQEPAAGEAGAADADAKKWNALTVNPALTTGDNTGIVTVKPVTPGTVTPPPTGGGRPGGVPGGPPAEIPGEVPGGEVSQIEP